MVAEYGIILGVLATVSGINISAHTPNAVKFTLSAVIGTAVGLFMTYAGAHYFHTYPYTRLPAFAIAAGAIMFLGSLLGFGLVALKRRYLGGMRSN
jgi:hypothetical protein